MAQGTAPLDLRLPKATEGMVVSVREVHVGAESAAPRVAPPVGSPSGLEQAPPVGAVMYLPFGGPSSEKSWRAGSAGTPEMQARFAETAYEVVVDMEDGERRTFRPREPGRFRVGQRVSLRTGELEPKTGP
ncbi:MAG TPA: hypothetical protein VE935_22520 [Burkholderiales bacterium]|jgi:hypothetical protein|nr:hypothetical protein [Burkholderiales bacterium]